MRSNEVYTHSDSLSSLLEMEKGKPQQGNIQTQINIPITVNSRYKHTRYKLNNVTGTLFRCTNFPPPNRLRYRHWHTTLQTHKKAICAYNELWRDWLLGGIIVSNGGFRPFPAQNNFSLKQSSPSEARESTSKLGV